jgi:anti-sigma regulatory factor (Ser/Thr protein kinase)
MIRTMVAPSGKSAVGRIEVVACTDPAELSRIRESVTSFVEAVGGSVDASDDVRLIVSELVTNVIRHTAATTVTVSIERNEAGWGIEVSEGGDIVSIGGNRERSLDHDSGRGLMVVNAIADTVEIVDSGSAKAVRCLLSID